MMQSVMHYFDKFFLTKMVKLKKAFFYIFACIFDLKIGTKCTVPHFKAENQIDLVYLMQIW